MGEPDVSYIFNKGVTKNWAWGKWTELAECLYTDGDGLWGEKLMLQERG